MEDEQLEDFMEELYEKQSSGDAAKEMLRQHLESQGVEWDGEI